MKVPEQALDIPDTEEFDVYEVTGVLDTEFKIASLDIVLHEDFNGSLGAEEIVEAPYSDQYIGLAASQIRIAPDGAVDTISGSTISSESVTNAVRAKSEHLEAVFK
jgi:Na+-translocating ferredoxin:NAD+ oxidoreductase RnfG subunit